jgi:hypothetical protein
MVYLVSVYIYMYICCIPKYICFIKMPYSGCSICGRLYDSLYPCRHDLEHIQKHQAETIVTRPTSPFARFTLYIKNLFTLNKTDKNDFCSRSRSKSLPNYLYDNLEI